MMPFRTGLVAGGLVLAATAWGDPPPKPITLDDAVAMAQTNALAIVQAQGQERTSAAGVRSAYASFIPSVSLSAGATRQLPSAGARTRIENGQIVTLPSEPWSSNVGLGANVQLFSGGRRFFDLHQAQARATIATGSLEAQRFATTLAVKQQYYNVLAARESEASAQAQLDQAEQQLRAAIARVRARNATRSDSLRSEIQVRSARLAVLDAHNAVELAGASLTHVVGAPYPVTAANADSLEPPALALDETALREMLENGPDVRQARASLDAARAARRGAWTSYLPSVNASYSRSGSGPGDTFFNDQFSYSGALRLSLSLPLFDQLQREAQVTQAEVGERTAEAAVRDARLGALESLSSSLGAFRSAVERVASETASVAAADEDLRVQRQRYAVGNSTILDVLTSQAQLDQARHDLIRARYDQRIAKAQLEALVGRNL